MDSRLPPYLTDDCQLVANSGRRRLRSADVDTCIVPRTNTQLGDRSFAVAGPRFWNTLLAELRQPDIELVTFWPLLKPICLSETQAHSDFCFNRAI